MFYFNGLCYFKRGLYNKQVNLFSRDGKAESLAARAGLFLHEAASVLACLRFAEVRVSIVHIGVQEKLALAKEGRGLIGLALRVGPWCRNVDFVC